MKKSTLFCLIIFLSFGGFSQTKQDSLLHVWSDTTVEVQERVQAILNLITKRSFHSVYPDSMIDLAKLQYSLAQSIKDFQKMGAAKTMESTGYKLSGKPDKMIAPLLEARELYQKVNSPIDIAGTLSNIGDAYRIQYEYEKAIPYFLEAVDSLEKILLYADGSLKKRAVSYLVITYDHTAHTYFWQGKFDQSIEIFFKVLPIKEERGDSAAIAGTMINIGNIHLQLENYEEAIEMYKQGVKIAEKIQEIRFLANGLYSMGSAYFSLKDYDKAMELYSQTLEIGEKYGLKRNILSGLDGKAFILTERGEFDEAIALHMRVLTLAQEFGNMEKFANAYVNLASNYYRKQNYNQAIFYGEKAYDYASSSELIISQRNASEKLYYAYKSTGQYQKALKFHEIYLHLRDSILSEKNQKAGLQQQFKYEYEKQKALDDLENEKKLELEREKKENQQIVSIAVGTGLIISLVLAIIIFNRLRVTRRQKIEIEAQKQRAERSEAVKEQFLANMSHEIRTPMHAISGMLKILERNEHPKAQEVFLDAMHKSSDNLIVLLNDILDLSKIEAGKLDVEHIPMQPEEVLDTVEQILRYKAEEKSLSFSVDIDESVPDWVMSDPTRLNQILINLAGNAIKFTEKGSVSISLSKKSDFLLYEVRDTGIGIPEDKLHSIFDAFEQAEGSTTRRFGGTGLGLNISRQLVELMGGNIWAESEVGKGSSFFVSLPLIAVEGEVADKQSLSEEQIMELGAALAGKRILLAEDNAFNQMIAADDLDYYAKGIRVDIVENGALALEKAKGGDYDLILMDVQMPEMDGIEASLKIREWEQANGHSPIPIIAMTASLLKSEVNLCLEAGMDNYIPKPYQAEELVGRIYEEIKITT